MRLRDPRFLHPHTLVALSVRRDGARIDTLDALHTLRTWSRDGALLTEHASSSARPSPGGTLCEHDGRVLCSAESDLRCVDAADGRVLFVIAGAGWAEVVADDVGLWVLTYERLAHHDWRGALRWSVDVRPKETAMGLTRGPDGTLWLRGNEGDVEQRDAHTGALTRTLPGRGEWGARDVSPDGAWLAMDGGGHAIVLVHLVTGEERVLPAPRRAFGVRFLRFAREGRRLIAAFNDGGVVCWNLDGDTPTERWQRTLPIPRYCPLALDGERLVVAANLRVWTLDVESGEGGVTPPCSVIRGLAHRDDTLYAFATNDLGSQPEQRIHRYARSSGAWRDALDGAHFFSPTPDGGLLCGAQVRVLRGDTVDTLIATPPQGYWFNREFRRAHLLADGDTVAVLEGGNRGWVELWSLARGVVLHAFKKRYVDLDVSRDGTALLVVPEKSELRWIDVSKRAVTRTIPLGRRRPKRVRLSPDATRVAVLDGKGVLTVVDLGSGEVCWESAKKVAHDDVAWCDDGASLWAVGAALTRYEAATGAVNGRWPVAGHAVLPLPDGRVAIGGAGEVTVFTPT